jgi:VIT1/CCC1 family predicted Fe2+/Mn2+ transporter
MAKLEHTLNRVRQIMTPWSMRRPPGHEEAHKAGTFLREVVFGANDGLVSNVSLVAGIAGGTANSNTVLLGGVAGLVAGAISMALGAYISTKSESEFRDSEEARERWEIIHMPNEERAEIRQIFREKGLSGPTLDAVVDQITANDDQWVRTMMQDELGFSDLPPRPVFAAALMGGAFALSAFFPVVPYLFLDGNPALLASVGMTATALFGMGAWRAYLTNGKVWRKAIEMVGFAGVAVIAANLIGRLVGIGIN